MTVLQDIKYIPPKNSIRRFKKTNKRLNISANDLESFAEAFHLSDWQKELVKAVDIDKRNFSQIARATNCSRQYVHQEYNRVYTRVVESGYNLA
jgi:hypothetical protein